MYSNGELSNSSDWNNSHFLGDEDSNLSMQIVKIDDRTDLESSGSNDHGMLKDEKMKKSEDPAAALHVLEDQLLDDSLLQFWRTGAVYERCTNMNPDDDELCDVSFIFYMHEGIYIITEKYKS